jgi:hypothetical protein
MKNDGNDEYYAIMSESNQTEFAGNFLNPKNEISENIIYMINILKIEVKKFNYNEYYKGVFHFSQPLTNFYLQIIIIIDYNNKIIQVNIPKFKDSILLDYFSIFAER